MSFETIRLEVADGVAAITFARPSKLNAFTAALHRELKRALDACEGDEAVRVVVLTGEGRAFSSGQDLTEDLARDAEGRLDLGVPLRRDYNPLAQRLVAFPKVTIAALNGPAVGASLNLALLCDLVVAARSAYLQQAFSKIALLPDAGGTWILPRIVGPKRALALMLSAEQLPAEEARAMGLVHRVFDDATFREEAAALARSFAQGPAHAYRLIKEAARASEGNSLADQLELEARLQTEAGRSADFEEGVAAFREKRAARFTGR